MVSTFPFRKQMREETRQDIISAEEMGTKYDEAAKEIWKNREILAPLLKYVDLEFQNKYRPVLKDGRSYPLIKRGIYYAAREISSQLGRITNQTNYTDIEKVIGIWVVNEDVPKELQNTASRYFITKEDYIGSADEPAEEYDLLEVVMIRRGENGTITEPLFKYLRSVYEANLEEIDKYTPVSANPELKEEELLCEA